jgi:hypothetical protein
LRKFGPPALKLRPCAIEVLAVHRGLRAIERGVESLELVERHDIRGAALLDLRQPRVVGALELLEPVHEFGEAVLERAGVRRRLVLEAAGGLSHLAVLTA